MRSLLTTLALVAALAAAGCGRKPARAAVVIRLTQGGLATVDGDGLVPEDLRALLKARAEASPRDADGLPALPVVISADPECEYARVQDAMVQCMRAYVWRVSWEMDGRRVDASLPRDDDGPVYVHEEIEDPVFIHEETGAAPPDGTPASSDKLAEVPELSAEYIGRTTRPPAESGREGVRDAGAGAAREPGESRDADRAVADAGHVRILRGDERSPEIRVRIFWENGAGRMIYSPTSPLPGGASVAEPAASTAGAHVVVKVNGACCADLDDLERRLDALSAALPEAYVVMDPGRSVPFEWVFRALEACRRSSVRRVLFQSPPPPESEDDWWWL